MNQKIAIPTFEGKLWQHFGKAPEVTFVTVENGQVKETVVLRAPEHEHGSMPRFIAAQGATDVLCGGLGQGAIGGIKHNRKILDRIKAMLRREIPLLSACQLC